jgi:hypothetical protein
MCSTSNDTPNERRCDRCYFCRDLAGTLQCLRNPPVLDLATGEARWPTVQPTDFCGAFCRDAPNPQPEITPAAPTASALNQKSQIINAKRVFPSSPTSSAPTAASR